MSPVGLVPTKAVPRTRLVRRRACVPDIACIEADDPHMTVPRSHADPSQRIAELQSARRVMPRDLGVSSAPRPGWMPRIGLASHALLAMPAEALSFWMSLKAAS